MKNSALNRTVLFCFGFMISQFAISQELEPRAYAALPKNLNAIVLVYGLSSGNVLTDPTSPIADFKITAHTAIGAYVRTFALGNKLARIQVGVPFAYMVGKLQIDGRDTTGTRLGFGDARIRLGINLIGTPPIDKKDFRQYTQKTIVGVSLVTSVPTGLYYKERRINLGSNRWGFKPEIGISKRFDRIYAEAYMGVWFFTLNNQYLVTKTLEQKPVFNAQAHASYYFKNLMWVSLNTTWFSGGKTLIDDVSAGNLLDNWRLGGTWAFPVAKGHSLKLQFHVGAFTATDYDYDIVSIGYQFIF